MTEKTVQTALVEDEGPSFPTGRTLLCAALAVGGIYLSGKKADVASQEWGWLLIGLAILLFTIMDARTGWTFLCHRPVSRSRQPGLFWACIATGSVLGAGLIGFSIGAVLGYWSP
ncbi:hypothetical protein [Dyella sp. RRB7]|uniref:hypothetical protein n=1 Tax=Dyella sp. RRB7 TaxID=2919502 RepID=UPI001FA96944|nr:hypothetical protein [Dyella sp. RRB7]